MPKSENKFGSLDFLFTFVENNKTYVMGWTTFHKPSYITPTQFFTDYFKREPNWELQGIAIVKRTQCYMAAKHKDTGEVICFVFMLTYGKGYENFGYKDMTEHCGPVIHECPEKIMKMLTPLVDDHNGWGKEWRERCWANINSKKDANKVKEGTIVKTENFIQFNGFKAQYFQKIKVAGYRNTFLVLKKVDGEFVGTFKVRFKLSEEKYEIISK